MFIRVVDKGPKTSALPCRLDINSIVLEPRVIDSLLIERDQEGIYTISSDIGLLLRQQKLEKIMSPEAITEQIREFTKNTELSDIVESLPDSALFDSVLSKDLSSLNDLYKYVRQLDEDKVSYSERLRSAKERYDLEKKESEELKKQELALNKLVDKILDDDK